MSSTLSRWILPALLFVSLLLPLSAHALAIGDPIPMKDAKLKNVNDAEVSISEVTGPKGTLVVFTCNHCPYVKAWEDRIVAIGNGAAAQGIGVIAINSNDPAITPEDGFPQMQERAKEKSIAFPYVVDGTSAVARAFGATKTPEVYLFDGSGKLAYHGAVDDSSESADAVEAHFLKDAIAASIAGKAAAPAETKALGCGIKFH